MYISQSYVYKINDIIGVSANLPKDATLLETMDVLYAEDNYELVRKSDNENVSNCIWLRNGDTQDNYIEVEIKHENPIN